MKFNVLKNKLKYKEIWNHYGFGVYPRLMGKYQEVVRDFDDVWEYMYRWNCIDSVFVSHNPYPVIRREQGKLMPPVIKYSRIFFDFDSHGKLENAQNDCLKLHKELSELDIEHWFSFSGFGFHLYIEMIPENWKYELIAKKETGMSHKDAFKFVIETIQSHFKNKLGLRTLDPACTSEPKKLCRVLYSRHADKDGQVDDRHCVPLSSEMLRWQCPDLINYCKNPKLRMFEKYGTKKYKLSKMITGLGLKLGRPKVTYKNKVHERISMSSDIEAILTIIEKGSFAKPCVINELMSSNPNHHARIYFATLCKRLGISEDACNDMWVNLGNRIGYVDLFNTKYREEQISSIYRNHDWLASCTTLKGYGICLGKKCYKYRE